MSVFDYRLNRKEQLLRKGEPIDNSVDFSGKTSPDFRNKFIAKMKDTNKMYQRESPGQFDDQRAEVVRNNLLHRQMILDNLMILQIKLSQMLS